MTSIVVPSTHAALPVPSTNFLAPRHNCGGEVEVSDLQRRVLREHTEGGQSFHVERGDGVVRGDTSSSIAAAPRLT